MTDDPRLGDLLGTSAEVKCVLLGFPVDAGVRRNGGRVGAAGGPAAIRRCLHRLTPSDFGDFLRTCHDQGDVPVTGDLEADQAALADTLAALPTGVIPIILGGGHETSYGHFLGYVRRGEPISIVNFDAHADVRPLRDGRGHSGSPFRQALDHPSGLCLGYDVLGLQCASVATAHADFVRQHGLCVWRDEVTRERIDAFFSGLNRPTFVTFDLDAVDQAFAPGVSAPATDGLTPDVWLYAAESAGRCPFVRSFDVVELNPAFDRDDQTARLAARTIWCFLRGLTGRLRS